VSLLLPKLIVKPSVVSAAFLLVSVRESVCRPALRLVLDKQKVGVDAMLNNRVCAWMNASQAMRCSHVSDSDAGPYGASSVKGGADGLILAAGLAPRVLLAEDNPANLFLLNSQLQRLGCAVTTVCNGMEALAQWRSQVFDCVITDLSMPLLDGYGLVRQLRSEGDYLPVIGISVDPGEAEQQKATEAGFDSLLSKPVSLQTLHELLLRYSLAACLQQLPVYQDGNLASLFDGDTVLMQKFVDRLLSSNDEDIAEAAARYAAGDLPAVASIIHKIKGAARLIDAQQVVIACVQLESVCQDGLKESAGLVLQALKERLAELARQLQGRG